MNRRNILLAGLLVVQLVVTAIVYKPGQQDRAADKEVHFFDLAADQVARMVITDRDDKVLTLQKKGDSWVVNPPDDFPGNAKRIGERLKQLLAAGSDRLVSRTRAGHARLRVGDGAFNRRIELIDGDGKKQTLYLGSSQGRNGIHVRRGDDDEVYFVRGISVWDFSTGASQWWRNRYVEVKADDLQGVKIVNQHGTLILNRGEDDTWSFGDPDSGKADRDKVKNLIDHARTITVADYPPKDKRPTVEEALVTLTLTTKNGKELVLKMGKEDEKGRYPVQGGGNPIPALINKVNVEPLLTATARELAAGEAADTHGVEEEGRESEKQPEK